MTVFVLLFHRLTDHEPLLDESYIKVLENAVWGSVLTMALFGEYCLCFQLPDRDALSTLSVVMLVRHGFAGSFP
ncbi:hypothetical protein [Chlorobaculum limnaeum]|uniref:hypothetical protein n=1 Tax=Chlorobaculum limnaeum TaxID=274537 RepID=UPI0012EEAAD5|nr:hypothetical protein [Chlorobaculum limnaeum]